MSSNDSGNPVTTTTTTTTSTTTTTTTAPFVRPDKPLSEQRIAVIGAGPCGLSVLCAFAAEAAQRQQEQQQSLQVVGLPKLTCFERQSSMGGQWNASLWRKGLDEYGEPVHSGMYHQLWSNGPKECLEFANYTFLQHFNGQDIPSYPPRQVLLDYITGRAKQFHLEELIQYNTAVRRVTYDAASNGTSSTTATTSSANNPSLSTFTVVTEDLKTQTETIHEFDYVFCCTGHFHVPHVPSFTGFEHFDGRILHAHDVKKFDIEFTNHDERLLIIGTSYSAEDVAIQAYKFGCRDITLSYRTAPMPFHFPKDVMQTRPLLTEIVPNTNGTTGGGSKMAKFLDGSTKEVDVIVLCTGYLHSFPFMEQSLRLVTGNDLWIESLYKGMFFQSNPRLIYMGMHDQWLTFNMFDAQAWYARDVILGRIDIPNDDDDNNNNDDNNNKSRQAYMKHWATRHEAIAKLPEHDQDEAMIRFQTDYTADLVEATDYPSWDYELTVQTFLDWEHAKHENILEYRTSCHKSAFTGSLAPSPRTPWLQNTNSNEWL